MAEPHDPEKCSICLMGDAYWKLKLLDLTWGMRCHDKFLTIVTPDLHWTYRAEFPWDWEKIFESYARYRKEHSL